MTLKSISTSFVKLLDNPARIFMIIAIPIGLFCVFVIPPLAGNDEISHIARVYELSKGNLVSDKMRSANNFGGNVPSSLVELYTSNYPFNPLKVEKTKIAEAKFKASKISINDNGRMSEISYSGAALYSPISYLPHTLALVVAKFFNMSVLNTVYLVRLSTLILFILLTFLAIRIIPQKKWFVLAIGILPMSLLLASNITLDGIVIGTCLLFIALIVRVYQQKSNYIYWKKYSINLFWILTLLATYLALAKPVYVPFLLLTILAIDKCFPRFSGTWIKWLGITVILPLVLMLSWNSLITIIDVHSGQRASVNSVGIYPPTTEQFLHDAMSNPVYFTKTFLHTYLDHHAHSQEIPNYILTSLSGKFTEYRIAPAYWVTILIVLGVVFAYYMNERRLVIFNTYVRGYVAVSIIFATGAISLSMYLYATTALQPAINGIQGRYFIPLIPFLLFLAAKKPLLTFESSIRARLVLLAMMSISILIMVYLLTKVFIR